MCDRVDLVPTISQVLANPAGFLTDLVVVLDASGVVIWVNDAADELLGREPSTIEGLFAGELAHPDDALLAVEALVSTLASGPGVKTPVVLRLAHASGAWVSLETIGRNVLTDDGTHLVVLTGRPLQRTGQHAVLDDVSLRTAAMFDRAGVGLADVAIDGTVLRANERLAEMVGRPGGRIAGCSIDELFDVDDTDDPAPGAVALLSRIDTDGPLRARCRRGDDHRVHVNLTSAVVEGRAGTPVSHSVQVADITELVEAQEELTYRSTHDPLTGVANRTLLDQTYAPAAPGMQCGAVYLDLDDFKEINDRHGHAAGDEVLRIVADRLREQTRAVDLVARLGGDEFVVVCADVDPAEVVDLAERLVQSCREPVVVGGAELRVGASAGAAFATTEGLSDLLRRADSALYRSKRSTTSAVSVDRGGPPRRSEALAS